jgi:hypothetical protein
MNTEIGDVKFNVYKTYLAAGGYPIWISLLVMTIIVHLKTVGEKVWIKIWTDAYKPTFLSSSTSDKAPFALLEGWPNAAEHPMFYVGVYAGIGLFGVAIRLIIVMLGWTAALNASRALFR